MFVCNQVELLPFQKARFLSEDVLNKRKRFRELKLTTDEEKKLQYFSKMNVSSLNECSIVEFQELYCKQRLFVGINSGNFYVNLEFTTDIHHMVKVWLKSYGYYLCPDESFHYDDNSGARKINPAFETKTKFQLLW